MTEKYNSTLQQSVSWGNWKIVWLEACYAEPCNTLLNLITKGRNSEHLRFLLEFFGRSNPPFAPHNPQVNYLYHHGIITSQGIEKGGQIFPFAATSYLGASFS